MQLLSPGQVEREIERIAAQEYCADPLEIIGKCLPSWTPPESIQTTRCATTERYIRNAEGDGKRLWSKDLTPYMVGIMEALDHPLVREVPTVGPGRCG